MLAVLLASAPVAAEELDLRVHGSVKSFFVMGFPYESYGLSDASDTLLELAGMSEEEALEAFGLSTDPFGAGSADGRLALEAGYGPFDLDVHYALSAANSVNSGLPGLSTGTGLTAPEAVPLTWTPDTGSSVSVQGRFDRLVLGASVPHVELALGRQAVSFGTGVFFAPMDLVNPFHPATIDTEYKPGVDALRVDAFAGVSSQLTVTAAWAGDAPLVGEDAEEVDLEGAVLAAAGRTTVGVTDLLAFAGLVHAEPVFGLGSASSIGPVGVHGEATLTLPEGDEDPFVRAVAGADWRPTGTTTLMAEGYVQTFGATDPDGYLEVAESERFTRGEIWQMGRSYAALTVMQEVTPLVYANVGGVVNVEDPSALAITGVSWSVADNATLTGGGYFGLGPRPDVVELDLTIDPATFTPTLGLPTDEELAASVNSEFGLYPAFAYLALSTYF